MYIDIYDIYAVDQSTVFKKYIDPSENIINCLDVNLQNRKM